MEEIHEMTVAELAEDAFVKRERVQMLEMMNTPVEYNDRKKAFIELSEARAAWVQAERALRLAIERVPHDF